LERTTVKIALPEIDQIHAIPSRESLSFGFSLILGRTIAFFPLMRTSIPTGLPSRSDLARLRKLDESQQ
jgi:hypothetical protein